LDGSKNKQKGKSEHIDLDARARITLAATTDIDESENARISKEENLTSEQIKDYLEDVLEEIKGTKDKTNKTNQKELG
jgi:hypothetical protein